MLLLSLFFAVIENLLPMSRSTWTPTNSPRSWQYCTRNTGIKRFWRSPRV